MSTWISFTESVNIRCMRMRELCLVYDVLLMVWRSWALMLFISLKSARYGLCTRNTIRKFHYSEVPQITVLTGLLLLLWNCKKCLSFSLHRVFDYYHYYWLWYCVECGVRHFSSSALDKWPKRNSHFSLIFDKYKFNWWVASGVSGLSIQIVYDSCIFALHRIIKMIEDWRIRFVIVASFGFVAKIPFFFSFLFSFRPSVILWVVSYNVFKSSLHLDNHLIS